MNAREFIARRVALELALEFNDGEIVSLGAGLPMLAAHYLSEGANVILHSENGLLGLGPLSFVDFDVNPDADPDVAPYPDFDLDPNPDFYPDPDLIGPGGKPCGMIAGAATFDSAFSFALIRGGHIDVCVLDALQVDEKGNFVAWMAPDGRKTETETGVETETGASPAPGSGMGGAMDLAAGAKKVIVAMKHCAVDGGAKILRHCTLPLTALGRASMIVTEMAVFTFEDGGLALKELAPGITLEQVRNATGAHFSVTGGVPAAMPAISTIPTIPLP